MVATVYAHLTQVETKYGFFNKKPTYRATCDHHGCDWVVTSSNYAEVKSSADNHDSRSKWYPSKSAVFDQEKQ